MRMPKWWRWEYVALFLMTLPIYIPPIVTHYTNNRCYCIVACLLPVLWFGTLVGIGMQWRMTHKPGDPDGESTESTEVEVDRGASEKV